MYTKTVGYSTGPGIACSRFLDDIGIWAAGCIMEFGGQPTTDGHDQATYTTGWEPYIRAVSNTVPLEFMKDLRDRIARKSTEAGIRVHGYWKRQEVLHGTDILSYSLLLYGGRQVIGCTFKGTERSRFRSSCSRSGFKYAVEKAYFTYGWTKPAVDEFLSLGYVNEIAHFVDCVQNNKTPQKGTTGEDGLQALAVIAAIYESAETGSQIQIKDNFVKPYI